MLQQLHDDLKNRRKTVKGLVEASFQTIKQTEGQLHNFLSLNEENALQKAEALDKRFDKGEPLSVLAGIPLGVKDNLNVRGQVTTCASKMLEKFVAPFTATAVSRLEDAGMIPVGKLNLDEFAMGSSTENSAYGPSRNPWDTDYVPGGSSGGSSSAVASGQVPVSLGSDTGGSIRQPAAFCGIVGIKPTYGRISRYGLVAFASSLDQIGPFTRTVEDTAHVLSAMSGHDVYDATSVQEEVPDFAKNLTTDIKGLRVALPKELFGPEIDDDVKHQVLSAVDTLTKLGVKVSEVSMPALKASIATYYILAPSEASSNLARFDGVRYTVRSQGAENLKAMYAKTRGEAFGKEVKRRIILGTYALSSGYYDAYYLKAQKARTLIKRAFEDVYRNFDVILSPTTPSVAFKFGEHAADPSKMYVADLCTIPANMAGLPAMSIPCGFSKGLPVGVQLIGQAFDEQLILNVGHAYQSVTDWHTKQASGVKING